MSTLDYVLQTFDGFCLVSVIILVVKRQVIDFGLRERKFRQRQLDNGACQISVERTPTQTANYLVIWYLLITIFF